MKAYRIIHVFANVVAFGLLGGFMIYFIMSYGGLPDRIGVHFSPADGDFDVYADKLFGFYPFAAGGVLLLIFSLLTFAVKKIKNLGMKVDEAGDRTLRCAAVLLLDLMKLTWAAFFSYWTYCVVNQTSMGDGTLLDIFRVFFILILISSPILFSRIREKHKLLSPENAETEDDTLPEKPLSYRIGHIAANVIAFGLLGYFLVYFLLSYGGLPERIGVHFGGNGEFDVYSYKVFGFYPFVAGGGLLLIFSLISLAVNKVKKIGLGVDKKGALLIRMTITEVLDCLKLIWSVFFSVWSYCVINQTGMSAVIQVTLIIAFLALFPITPIVILVIAKRHRIKTAPTADENKETETGGTPEEE